MPNGPFSGKVEIQTTAPQPKVMITLDGNTAVISAGDNGLTGTVVIKNQIGNEIVRLGHTFLSIPGQPPVPFASGLIMLKNHISHQSSRFRIHSSIRSYQHGFP
jgi:hypothetical protein